MVERDAPGSTLVACRSSNYVDCSIDTPSIIVTQSAMGELVNLGNVRHLYILDVGTTAMGYL